MTFLFEPDKIDTIYSTLLNVLHWVLVYIKSLYTNILFLCFIWQYYKWYVLTQVPELTNFDFSGVTKADRQTAKSLSTMTPQKKKKNKPKE